MGRTYKKLPRTQTRCPRGRKKALGEGGRGISDESQLRAHSKAKAIPPDDWNEVGFDSQCFLPIKIAREMLRDGMDVVSVARKISLRFHIPYSQVLIQIVRCAERIAERQTNKKRYLMQEVVQDGKDRDGDERTSESSCGPDLENE
jgi:hypothetical protein